jgi:amino acid adenylation domain-containing protein/thioester reductase-like protein
MRLVEEEMPSQFLDRPLAQRALGGATEAGVHGDVPRPVLLPEDAHRLAGWEWGPVRARPAKRFHELFEAVAQTHPHRPAVVTATGSQSYAELDLRANQIARLLLDHGVAHEEAVAVLTECSADLPATVLGIWKAGAAYLPLTIEQPPARLAFMVRDAEARVLIALDEHIAPPALAQAVKTILRPGDWNGNAERPEIAGSPRDLAYVVYTSGTTGMPKGALMQHDSLINAAYMSGETFGLTSEDRVSLVATPGFDASLWELGMALLHGMAIVPVSRSLRDDPWALKRWYTAHGVTVAFHAPSYLRVSQQTPFEGLRVLITGGEAPNHEDARRHAGHLDLWNAYGPTETCIFVCAEHISAQPETDRPLAVGRPLANTRISIRSGNGDLTPPGELGEVWLGGTGLARGYLNNLELTAQRFVETPDGRFYRSGDLGRWTDDGRLELAGRIDDQVKLHGQRVELGEIGEALRSHPAVEEAFTLVDAAAEETKVLRAFVRLRPETDLPLEDELRRYLSGRLPAYMVPASVTFVAAIPLTAAGKIDREALLDSAKRRVGEAAKTLPRGEMEMRIAAVWREMLGEPVSREDNFFALGGNSLLAVTMAHRLSRELDQPIPTRELFAAPTLAGFSQRIELLSSVPAPVPVSSDLATEGQREFWVAQTAGLDIRMFTIPLFRIIEGGHPSTDQWNKAWAALVERHEALRTYFFEDAEGRLRSATTQGQTPALEIAIQPDRSAARAYIRQRQGEPFDMGTPPLWRAGLVEVADSAEHLFWMALHHSVGDGRSIGIIVEELGALLRDEQLPLLAGDFGESAHREEEYLGGPACAADHRFWYELLLRQPDTAFAEAPLDFSRSMTAKPGNHRFEMRLGASTTEGLKTLARQHDASLHAVILTLLALEARRRMGREDLIIGATASTRETASEDWVVGYYVNMLPLPCHLPRQITFSTALRETQQTLAAGLQHARYPFARMYHDFWDERPEHHHPGRYPLFDLAVTENPESPPSKGSLRLSPLSAPAYELTGASPGQDMVLIHECLADGGLLLQWHVNAALYTRETAKSWFDALSDWAVWLAEDRERASEALPWLLPREAALLEGWEQGAKACRPRLGFHELFESVLDRPGQSERPAVISQAGVRSYSALEQEANAIAHSLLLRGAAKGAVAGVLTGRSANLPATVLGIWKAGAIYLPLAADLPTERLNFIARDAGITLLIALDGLAVPLTLARELPPPLRPEELDSEFRRTHDHRPPPVAGTAAYIIYTSGSSGQPKGTLIGYEAYVNSVLGFGEAIGMTRDDRSLMFASPSFDVSLSDIGLPLAFGAAMCPVPHEVLSSPNRFKAFLTEFNVTVADMTPTYLRLFEGASLPSLRILVTGGEAPFPADVRNYAGRLQYFNAYGPTENTITSTLGRLSSDGREVLTGGRPLPNTSVHLCDPDGEPVPPGVAGELWLGGTGLANGYVGRPELTAAAFVETARGRRYRSGDLGRWHSNGELEIIGRTDDQVKLNGIRIELGEIEAVLSSHPSVAQAVALLDGGAEKSKSLWAFVRLTPGRELPTNEIWQDYLADRLPGYMIPSAVIAVPDLPLSSSGKVDKAALKMLLDGRSSQGEESLPHEGLEADIARLWSELLGHDNIHRGDNFFSLGGHSLLAIAVAQRLEEALGHPIPARELFVEPTLAGFARRVSQLSQADLPALVLSDRATEGQREFWVAERAGLDTRGFNIALTLSVCGRVPRDPQWSDAWAELVTRHDALRTRFYEDSDGVLRRSTSSGSNAGFEISTWPEICAALAHIRARQTEAFVMGDPPLWRAGVARVAGPDDSGSGLLVFWLALHHSVADGVSLGVLKEDLSTLLQGGKLPAVTNRFDQSAGQEESYLAHSENPASASPVSASHEDAAYWRGALDGLGDGSPDTLEPFDEWPLDFPRPLVRTEQNAKGAHDFRIRLDAAITASLRDLAQRNGSSLHTLMLTILALEVRRRTGRPAFLLGTAASTRDSVREARIVGYYVNMLPVPCRVQGFEPFEECLRTMQRNLAEGLQHARYPFARIYKDFRKDHPASAHPARYPLFDFAVTENPGTPATTNDNEIDFHFSSLVSLTGKAAGYELHTNGPAQDMVLVHESQPDGSLMLRWLVNAAIYDKETAEAWIDSLAGWARFLAEGKRLQGSRLPALLPEEERLLAGWEQGPSLPHSAPSFPALFEHWTRVQPESPAVVTESGAQSYAVVDARSNAIAAALQELGVERQEAVGVFTGQSIALPEVVMAIWKAGACYLPLVKELPAERLAFMARDAGVRVLVALDGLEPPASLIDLGCEIFRPESLDEAYLASHSKPAGIGTEVVEASQLAYIIYTSGSTGVPKGVMLRHQGLNNLALGIAAALEMQSVDRASIMASPAFDAWISELVMAWAVGGAVVPVLRDEMDDILEVQAMFIRLGVTVTTMPPSYLRLFEQADFPSLRLLLTAGEPPNRADALHYASQLIYMNGYGPTENTVAVSYGQITAQTQRLTAGKPLPNTSVHLRGSHGEPLPPGAIGTIWLGGMQLASGYLRRPDLTAASFVETPTGRLYCTGDLGRWARSGELEVLGRIDGQVKLRGQRVELGEIEHRLGTHPDVRQAVAVVEKTSESEQTLWAFACLHSDAVEPNQAAWQDFLSATLPSAMLPFAVIRVPVIPVTIAGKVDREALLRIASEWGAFEAHSGGSRGTPPREGLEERIAQIWAEHLKCGIIVREDSFFDLGGDSLRAIATVNHLRRTLECTVNDLYEHPRLMDFAGACRHRPEHLRAVIQSATQHWREYRKGIVAYETERDLVFSAAEREYGARNQIYAQHTAVERRDYSRVLLTGATGYLGSYLLRELLADRERRVSVLIRGDDDRSARARLGVVLCHYFGPAKGVELRDDPRLTVLASDLRRDDLGLSPLDYTRLANSVQAVFHCAANVKHFGHYREFHASNAAATGNLLKLAAHRAASPADFHLVSTLSVCGKAPESGFRLFTEYDPVPEALDENYYIRSKQQAERLVVEARQDLANACIHRVGNMVFDSEGGPLQLNIGENAFFRQLAAFIHLGAAPDDSHLWLCHVDVVARGIALLAGAANLSNETHHLENSRRDSLAGFVSVTGEVRACSFDAFLERLEATVDEPGMDAALSETLETFGLYRGVSPQSRARRLEIVSGRTQMLLAHSGLVWPPLPAAGQREMLQQAAQQAALLFSRQTRPAHSQPQTTIPAVHAVQIPHTGVSIMDIPTSLNAVVDPVIALVPSLELRDALRRAFSEEHAAVLDIEEFFRMLPLQAWSEELLHTFACSWKATHLKMLAIYGLSCRLQRMADGSGDLDRPNLYLAAARNASTSYEDLGLDFDGHTHAELYDNFAEALTGGDLWQLRRYRLPEAHRFSQWVFRNMVVEAIPDGLLTNMFSEIYNHGEYSIALPAADSYFERHTRLTAPERRKAITYIAAHVEDEVEAAHFLVVAEALDRYLTASKTQFDPERACSVFSAYLRNLGQVMRRLTGMMQNEFAGRSAKPLSVGVGA